MNLKFAHLVAVQFGILIGIVACLAFLHFENAKPRTATLAPKSEPEDGKAAFDSRDELEPADRLAEQSAYPLPSEYSPEAVEKSRAILAKLYYEQIAPRRNTAAVPATYTKVVQEPTAVQVYEPPPQPVAYNEPTEVVVYPPSGQFISFARPRPFVNRCRPAPPPDAVAANSVRRRNNGPTHASGLPGSGGPAPAGFQHRRAAGMPACPSPSGSSLKR